MRGPSETCVFALIAVREPLRNIVGPWILVCRSSSLLSSSVAQAVMQPVRLCRLTPVIITFWVDADSALYLACRVGYCFNMFSICELFLVGCVLVTIRHGEVFRSHALPAVWVPTNKVVFTRGGSTIGQWLWDKIASERSGAQERIDKRRRCQNAVRKRDFVTFTMMSVKHPVAHRPQIGAEQRKKNAEEMEPA